MEAQLQRNELVDSVKLEPQEGPQLALVLELPILEREARNDPIS